MPNIHLKNETKKKNEIGILFWIPISVDNVAMFIELVRVSEFQLYAAFFAVKSSIFESLLKTGESNFDPLAFAAFRAHCANSADMFLTHGLFSFFHFEFVNMREGYALSHLKFSTRPADLFSGVSIRRCFADS